jgi:predicted transcriptional regulator
MGTKSRKLPTNQELVEFKALIKILKRILRERGMSYAELANLLSLSESGVKKIFASRDCSFTRLSQISRVLGFQISDILAELSQEKTRGTQFSPAQQEYFLKNPDVFKFFVKLVIERETVAEIKEKFHLSDERTFQLLKKLDDLKLIQLMPGGRPKLPPLFLVKNFGSGPLLEKVYQEWGGSIVKDLAHPKYQESGQFLIRCYKMKQDTYQDLLHRLLELENEFLKRAVREMSISTEGLKTVRFAWLTDQQSFIQGRL